MYVTDKILPELPAPSNAKGLIHWLKNNLFSSPINIVITFLGFYLVYKIVPPAIQWALLDATWFAETREECLGEGKGACWAYIGNRTHVDSNLYS